MHFVHAGKAVLEGRLRQEAERMIREHLVARGIEGDFQLQCFWIVRLHGSGSTAHKVMVCAPSRSNPRGIEFAVQPGGNTTRRRVVVVFPRDLGKKLGFVSSEKDRRDPNSDMAALFYLIKGRPQITIQQPQPVPSPTSPSPSSPPTLVNSGLSETKRPVWEIARQLRNLLPPGGIRITVPRTERDSQKLPEEKRGTWERERKAVKSAPLKERIPDPPRRLPFFQFVSDFIAKVLAKERRKGEEIAETGWVHVVYSGFSKVFRSYYGEEAGIRIVLRQLENDGLIELRLVKGGAIIRLVKSEKSS